MAEDRFLPGRHAIEKFGNGGFRFGGMSHQGSLLILPSGMRALAAKDLTALTPSLLVPLVAEKSAIDILLLGTGESMLRVPSNLGEWLRGEGLPVEAMSTAAVVRTYNVLVADNRRVAAILIAVGHAGG